MVCKGELDSKLQNQNWVRSNCPYQKVSRKQVQVCELEAAMGMTIHETTALEEVAYVCHSSGVCS